MLTTLHRHLRDNARLKQVKDLFELGQSAYSAYLHAQAWHQSRRMNRAYSISVGDQDPIYHDLQSWLLGRVSPTATRALKAYGSYKRSSDGTTTLEIKYLYDGSRPVHLVLEGHPITVSVVGADGSEADDNDDAPGSPTSSKLKRENRLTLTTHSRRGQQAIVRMLDQLLERRNVAKSQAVYQRASWGSWERARSLEARPAESVVLADGLMDRLLGDVRQFLDNEETYRSKGLPWHRGYLLSGPPGTGKTSSILALAQVLKLDVYYLSVRDLESDTQFLQAIRQISERSILLLEDIDVLPAAATCVDGDEGVSDARRSGRAELSAEGLLNGLDGALTPQGLIVMMTTNHKEVLDPALLRPGRCDLQVEIGYLTDAQLARLVAMMTGIRRPLPALGGRDLSPAEVVECVKANITDMEAAHAAILALLLHHEEVAA